MDAQRRVSREFEKSSHVGSGFIDGNGIVTPPSGVERENQGRICPPSGPCVNPEYSGKPFVPLATPPKRIDDIGGYLEEGFRL